MRTALLPYIFLKNTVCFFYKHLFNKHLIVPCLICLSFFSPVVSLFAQPQVASGPASSSSFAITTTGKLFAWGDNSFGKLGNGGQSNNSALPEDVSAFGQLVGKTIVSVASGTNHTLALASDGTVYAWGFGYFYDNRDPQINYPYNYTTIPLQVTGLTDVIAIAAGYHHSLALKSDGTVYAWGFGDSGQLGNGKNYSNDGSAVPEQVIGLTGIMAIAAGYRHSLALKSDGSVYAWGNGIYGQLGDGVISNNGFYGSNVPVRVHNLTGIKAIAGGGYHSLALHTDGTIYGWGLGISGQLGNGAYVNAAEPVPTINLSGVTAIAAGENHSLALKTDGTVYAWGGGSAGQLGNGRFYDTSPFGRAIPQPVNNLSSISSIAGGSTHSLAMKADGTVYAWGANENGQLGNGEYSNSALPVQVIGLVPPPPSICAKEKPAIEWDKTFGGTHDEQLQSVQQTSDGGYILGGWSSSNLSDDKSESSRGGDDYWVVKLNADGSKAWDKTIGGNGGDYLQSLLQTEDGGYILGGTSLSDASGDKSENNKGATDYWIVKLDAAGSKEWDRTIGGNGVDDFTSFQQTKDGGYILGGRSVSAAGGDKSENNNGATDYWVVKLNAAGVKVWDKTFGGNKDDYLQPLQQTEDGGYILGGTSLSDAGGDKSEGSKGFEDYWVVKLNAAGIQEWDKTVGGTGTDYLSSLQQTQDGGYILGGHSNYDAGGDKSENSKGGPDYWVVKLNASGSKEWDKTIGGDSYDYSPSIRQTTDSGYILGGYTLSGKSGDKSENSKGDIDFWVIKLDASGCLEWDKTIGGNKRDVLASLQQTTDSGYILGGYSDSDAGFNKSENTKGVWDFWVVKLKGEEPPLPVFCTQVAVADTIAVTSTTSPMTFRLQDLLSNDAEELELDSFTQPTNGTLAYNPNNRRFSYTPVPGAIGSVTFTYTLQEDSRLSNPYLVDGQAHYYELVRLPKEITWEQAQALAASMNYNGRQGYLATITSAAENEHIRQLIRNNGWRSYSWLGGSDAQQEGSWRWATGPEAGTMMNYTNWVAGEPNNIGEEDYLVLSWDQGRWNDLSGVATGRMGVKSFVVEYGSASDCAPALTATVTLDFTAESNPDITTRKAENIQEPDLKIEKSVLAVYPNPVQDRATIQMGIPATGSYRLDLYDSRGAKVKTITQGLAPAKQSLVVELNVGAYPKGIYLLRLETQQGVLAKRLVIDR